jgi:2-oxoglutarate ferredoxin oxidoreductase subunit beta
MNIQTPPEKLKPADYASDQEVRWCPGCGDYAILKSVHRALADMQLPLEKVVFISGIGCAARFPYYMSTYGFHTIHGRAPAIATGTKLANPDLDVWVVMGDGDALSIGGNHTLHAIRRNVDMQLLLFNNEIYGLTKGQYSPTSKVGTKAPSTPYGSIDYPVNPIALALGAGATFVARVSDTDAKLFTDILTRAHQHKGTALIEVLQNCPVFNDGIWDGITEKTVKDDNQLLLEHGKPLLFGKAKDRGIRLRPGFTAEVVEVGDGPGKVPASELLVHDEIGSPVYHYLLSQLVHPQFPVPMGVLKAETKPSYDELSSGQVAAAIETRGKGDLEKLLHSGMTWEVGPDGVKH